jgi:hypothetical protein
MSTPKSHVLGEKTFKEISDALDCDKTTYHMYDQFYPLFLESKRSEQVRILEVGLDEGKSVKIWREYLPKATIIGVDVLDKSQFNTDIFIQADQSSWTDMCDVADQVQNVDIIIDDGSHVVQHQINTFEALFPRCLAPGGVYIIEDIECSYWKPGSSIYGYTTDGASLFDYFINTHHTVNAHINEENNFLNIKSISYFQNAIVIQKQNNEEIARSNQAYRFKFNIEGAS